MASNVVSSEGIDRVNDINHDNVVTDQDDISCMAKYDGSVCNIQEYNMSCESNLLENASSIVDNDSTIENLINNDIVIKENGDVAIMSTQNKDHIPNITNEHNMSCEYNLLENPSYIVNNDLTIENLINSELVTKENNKIENTGAIENVDVAIMCTKNEDHIRNITNEHDSIITDTENAKEMSGRALVSDLFSNMNLVELLPASTPQHEAATTSAANTVNIKVNENQTEMDSCCFCKNENDSDNQEICTFCQLLRCASTKDDKKHFIIKEKYRFFDDAVTLSQHLMEESTTWLADSIPMHKTDTFKLENQTIEPFSLSDSEIELNQNGILDIDSIHADAFHNGNIIKAVIENDLFLDDIEDGEIVTGNKYCFHNFPEEVKLKIFSFFTQRELCCYVAPVCSSWFHLSKDPLFWTHILAADFEDAPSSLLVDVINAWCKNLAVLELNRRTDVTYPDFQQVFQNCPFIQSLSLAFCSQFGDNVLCLLPIHCKYLTSINMEGCNQITDQSFYNFVGLPLTSVCVSHCNQLSDDGGIFLARNFLNLTEINFDGIQWITEDFVEILVANHSKSLQKVYLDGENLTDNTVKLFSQCPNLSCLSFSFCTNMTHEALSWVGKCKKLNHLMLRKGANFTNEALLDYLKNMSKEQALDFKHLNLAECTEISDECLFHLSEKCSNLKTLDLSWCWEVSDDGMGFIIDSCHKLKELYLRGLHELYGIPFSRIMKNVPELTFLDLSQCNKVPDELIERVVEKMNNLIVYNYYGDMVVNALHRKGHLIT